MMKIWWDIFIAFFRPSILTYGGGPASIPLMRQEVVDNFAWFTNEQFADALAMANTLPGPIAPKLGAYTGYQVAGVPGAVIAVAATVVPMTVVIVLIAGFLMKYKNSPHVRGMLTIAKPIVVVLLLQTALEMCTKNTYPNIAAYVVSILAFIAVVFLKVHPGLVMLIGLVIGFSLYKFIL